MLGGGVKDGEAVVLGPRQLALEERVICVCRYEGLRHGICGRWNGTRVHASARGWNVMKGHG